MRVTDEAVWLDLEKDHELSRRNGDPVGDQPDREWWKRHPVLFERRRASLAAAAPEIVRANRREPSEAQVEVVAAFDDWYKNPYSDPTPCGETRATRFARLERAIDALRAAAQEE